MSEPRAQCLRVSAPARSAPAPYLVSARFDWAWFAAPGLISVAAALALVQLSPRDPGRNLWLWIFAVLLVDVAHVYASLYRTYLDADARALHGRRLWFIPLACFWFGALLHLASPLGFWSALAYLAVFHFIKQHIGFAALYLKAGDEPPAERAYTHAAIWACTLGPILYWHTVLPREFAWFTETDFVGGLPRWVGQSALAVQVPVLVAFLWRRLLANKAGRRNPMLLVMVLLPALTWNMGMVWFNDDRVFTLTNVLLHGVPYLALVWITGGRDQIHERFTATRERPLLAVALFYALLVLLATTEEGLWDRWVWHDHPELFGSSSTWLEGLPLALVVAMLTLPQATHYVLDRFIWKAGPDNPKLAQQLGLAALATPRCAPPQNLPR